MVSRLSRREIARAAQRGVRLVELFAIAQMPPEHVPALVPRRVQLDRHAHRRLSLLVLVKARGEHLAQVLEGRGWGLFELRGTRKGLHGEHWQLERAPHQAEFAVCLAVLWVYIAKTVVAFCLKKDIERSKPNVLC